MYYETALQPQVADTDFEGFIDYMSFSRWFDRARTTFYNELFPKFQLKPHGLVVVKTSVEFFALVTVDDAVKVRTWVSRIGNKSFDITQELWFERDGQSVIAARGHSIFSTINFNYHKSEPLNERFLEVLRKFFWEGPDAIPQTNEFTL